MRILALITDIPFPPITGSRVRNFHLWSELKRQGAEVKILGLSQESIPNGSQLQFLAENAEFFPLDRPLVWIRGMNALLRSYHENPLSSALFKRVQTLIDEWRPDIIHAEEIRMATYAQAALALEKGNRPKITLTAHNVESDLLRQTGSSPFKRGKAIIDRLHLRSLKRFERRIFESFDLCFAYSSVDRDRYHQLYPRGNWAYTRNGTDVSGVIPAPQVKNRKILFVGSLSYYPNVHGLEWFLEEVLPKLPADISLTVAGSRASEKMRKTLNQSRVSFVDTPADLGPIYQEHALSVVPLFEGSGTRGKILESLAHERVLVTTTLGAEGLDLTPREGVICRDESLSFSGEIARLVDSPEERSRLGAAGRQAVHNRYDWSVVAEELLRAWNAAEVRLR